MAPISNATATAAGFFLMSVAESFNIYSALNSSPWTAENFGADEEKARSTRQYVMMSSVVNLGLGVGTSLLADNWWPFFGIVFVTVVMYFLYERALHKGKQAGSNGWLQ